ncbi:MAG: VCBS repeat domain-containing M23 family metallopeptidase [Parcubacteria group bacterium]
MKLLQQLCIVAAIGIIAVPITVAAEVRPIVFPVIGSTRYSNDFGAPRSGHTHQGNDIIGSKLQPLIAAVTGTIYHVEYPQPSYGYAVFLRDSEGYRYWYIHINNDTPGTDDGQGGGMNAYAPGMRAGDPVTAGQLVGWMGDSGNAEGGISHLHFEIHRPDGTVINPFDSLNAATRIGQSVVAPPLPNEILPYGEFRGGTSVAVGEIVPSRPGLEIVTGAGPGGGPHVKVYDAEGNLLNQFFPYPPGFRGGVDVATGDINGDGVDEIITGAGPGGGPHVRVMKRDGTVIRQFFAYIETFRGGVRVAAADLNGDGKDEVVTGAGPGGGPHVRIFDNKGNRTGQFFAYAETFRGGIDVAAVNATEETPAAIITSAGPGGGPHVRVFNRQGKVVSQFFPYASEFRGGVRIDAANVDTSNDRPEIVVVPASGGGANIRFYGLDAKAIGFESEFEEWWRGGYDIAAGEGTLYVSSLGGPRRASIRNIISQMDE